MQAYHQSFNPQAYIANSNGAAAAAAAAAYYTHHNPANYVLPTQYSITDGFSYSAAANPSSAAVAALVNTPQAYNSQVCPSVICFAKNLTVIVRLNLKKFTEE